MSISSHCFGTQGRPHLLYLDDIDYLLHLVCQQPDWFLDELLHLLKTNHFICVNYVTIYRTLVQAGAPLKKLKKIAMECNEPGQNAFIQHMAQYSPDELGFIDETSKNEKTVARSHGHAQKGQRAEMQQHFVCGHCLTATSLLTINRIATSKVIEGLMTKSLYLEFLKQEVVHMTSILSFSPLLTVNWNTDAPLHGLSRSVEHACNG